MIQIEKALSFTNMILCDLNHEILNSVYDTNNIMYLSEICGYLLDTKELNDSEIKLLSNVINIGNTTYENTDKDFLPIDNGIYDLLLEKYKGYNENYQIGAKPIHFENRTTESELKELEKETNRYEPIKFFTEEEQKKVDDMIFPEILYRTKKLSKSDMMIQPITFADEDVYITKRLRNTSHEHPELVGTLDKCKFVLNKEAIDRGVFDDSNVKILERDFFGPIIESGIMNMNDDYVMILELKYDGISVEADIEDGRIVSARTRGDTNESVASDLTPILGDYIFPNAYCKGIEPFGMKFEAIITKPDIEKLNRMKGVNYVNARTAMIGIQGSSDARRYRELITLIPLATTLKDENGEPIDRLVEIEFMNRFFCRSELLRFSVIHGNYVSLLYQIKKFVEEAEFARTFLPFMYDGVVLSFYDPKIRARLGRKNSVNKYSIAIKFNALRKLTTFLGYTFEVGQNGVITPMIHYQPVEFIGTRHTKSTGNSYERFKELNLKIGDLIAVEYVNDVMPRVSSLDIEHNRLNQNAPFPFPAVCPECGSALEESESGKSIYCPNIHCKGRAYKRMESMMSKLGIKDFAYESIKALEITCLKDLMIADDEKLSILGPNDKNNLKMQLLELQSKPIYDYKIIGSLGFKNIAIKTFRLIFENFSIYEFKEWFGHKHSFEEVINRFVWIKGIGEKTLKTIYDEYPFYENDINFIIEHFNIIPYHLENHITKEVVFTGFRDAELSNQLELLGFDANPNNNLTKSTHILIVPNKNFQSSKISKAIKYGVKIMDVNEVRECIKNNVNF